MDLDSNAHSVFLLHYHLVLVVKYRRQVFDEDISSRAKEIFEYIAPNYNITLKEWNHDKDHVHILLEYSPKVSVSDIVKQLKQYSTYQMWKIHGDYLSKQYWKHHILWSDGYFACSIGQVSQEIRLLKNISKIKGNGNERCVSTHLKVCGYTAVNI